LRAALRGSHLAEWMGSNLAGRKARGSVQMKAERKVGYLAVLKVDGLV